ncbi:MAG TPA: hypothetical protein VHL11_02500 [Phototrophicaceae bacterium]|jgi:hypothetical protein|nr:hypothetical protein [Phototrophicaceae bacterium]
MRKNFTVLLLITLFVSGCNFAGPVTAQPQDTPTRQEIAATEAPAALPPTALPPTEEPSALPPSPTPNLTPLPSATSAIFPVVSIAADTICRVGPDKRYNAVMRVTKGQSFDVSGRSEDSTWVSVDASKIGDDCWVPVANLESPGDLSALNVRYTQPLPDEPMNVTASDNACGVKNHLWLYWQTVNAVGYRIYRNGKEIATVYGSKYRDLSTPSSKLPTIYLYEVESFNASGVSPRAGVSVTICG